MENDKTFELLTKMYSEIQGMNKRLGNVETDVKKMDIKLEEIDKKVDLSLEGHKTNAEQFNRIEQDIKT